MRFRRQRIPIGRWFGQMTEIAQVLIMSIEKISLARTRHFFQFLSKAVKNAAYVTKNTMDDCLREPTFK